MSNTTSRPPSASALARNGSTGTNRERRVRATPDRSAPESGEPRLERIGRRAHEIYEARGGQHGRALDDWLQAEREIDAEMDSERDARD
jgi:hypothetical protein